MAQTFNTILSFVKSTSRKDRRKGVGSLSVSAVAGGGVGSAADSATQAWVRDNFVDKTTEQEISALKIFSQGIKIGDVSLFKHPDGYVYLDETLVLKGGVVMYGNGSGAEVPSIFDSLPIDGRTIKRDGNGALYVDETALSVSGGGGGGGVASSVHWNNVTGKPSWIGSTKPTYKYSEIEERPDLSVYAKLTDIPSLNGYATQSWVENKGYLLATTASSTYQSKITTTNKLAYSLISGTPDLSVYFLKTSFTKDNIKNTLDISDWALASAKPTYTASEVGALGVNGTAQSALKMTPEYLTDLNNATPWRFFDMRSGYGSTDGNKPNVAWVSGITGTVAGSSVYRWQLAGTTGNARPYFRQESNGTWGNWQRLAFTTDLPTKLSHLTDDVVAGNYLSMKGGTINGSITATSFIGNLTGNADSATKLAHARTIWGQSFDGTGNITGAMTVDGDAIINGVASVIYKYGTSTDGTAILSVGSYKSNPYGLIFYSNGAQTSSIQSQLFDNSLYTTLCLNHKGGNVAIGGTTADAKLHVHGTAKFEGDTTFSSKKIVIGTIPIYQSADGTLFVDANVVFSGGVAMYGNTTTTVNEE